MVNKNKKYKILYIILLLVLILIICISLYYITLNIDNSKLNQQNNYQEDDTKDNYSCDLDIMCDREVVKPGEIVTYDINATNIQAKNGIIMFETLIDYDKEIFEMEVKSDDNSSWNVISLIDNYLTMIKKDLMPSSEDQLIAKVRFKVKDTEFKDVKTINFSKIKLTIENDEYFTKLDIKEKIKIEQ